MWTQIRPAVVSLVFFTALTGIVYPLVVTGIAQTVFPRQANGNLIDRDGKAIGSTLIGQQFDDPKYFWGRLSATSPAPYDASSSSGSNLGPTNAALLDAIRQRVDVLKQADPDNTKPIPVDLVTASASGLDPHVSPAARKRVLDAIVALDYHPSAAGRMLRTGIAHVLGVITPPPSSHPFAQTFFPYVLEGIGECAAERGYDLPPSKADCHLTRPQQDHARSNVGKVSHPNHRRCRLLALRVIRRVAIIR